MLWHFKDHLLNVIPIPQKANIQIEENSYNFALTFECDLSIMVFSTNFKWN